MDTTLPIHPRTGLRALGVLPSGRPVWPVVGGSGDGDGGQGDGGTPVGTPAPDTGTGQGGGDGRAFSQTDVDRIVADRLARERAKFADYDDVKAKAAELDKLREAEKTDLEKLQGTHEETLGKLSRVEHELRVTRAAAKHGLGEDAIAFLHGETDDEVDAAAAKLAELTGAGKQPSSGGAPRGGRPDPSQGRGSSGDGATSVAAGRDRYRARYGTKTT